MILVSIAFQRYIASPIWAMLAEVQPSTGGSSGRTNQAVKLQKTQVHHDPRAKSANERVTEVQGKTTGSSTTTRNAFQVRIKECKTKSLKRLLQEVHVLL